MIEDNELDSYLQEGRIETTIGLGLMAQKLKEYAEVKESTLMSVLTYS